MGEYTLVLAGAAPPVPDLEMAVVVARRLVLKQDRIIGKNTIVPPKT